MPDPSSPLRRLDVLTPAELTGVRLRPDPLYLPKVSAVPRVCGSCPFHPSGGGLARTAADFPLIAESVAAGLPFYCHGTVLKSPLTTYGPGRDGMPTPDPAFQPHFRACAGAVAFKRGELAIPPAGVQAG